MTNRASALILALFVILVLGILSSSFLFKQVNQSFLSNRYADSLRALWIAEAGLHEARHNFPSLSSINQSFGAGSYAVDISQIGSTDYYRVISTGAIVGSDVSRTIDAVITPSELDGSRFRYGLESTVDIDFKGSTQVWGENSTQPVPSKYRDPNYYRELSNFTLQDLFTLHKEEVRDLATVWDADFPPANFTGINWIDDPETHYNGDIDGSGILIINGNVTITGTIDFNGIIYVIGELKMAGTSYVNGSILAESAAEVDTTVTGTADIQHNTTNIQNALDCISDHAPSIVAWKEM